MSIGAAGELQVHKHPVVKDNNEGVAGEAQIIVFRGNRKALLRSLDCIRALVQLGIHRHEIENQRAILVKPRLLLHHNRVLILDPGLEHGAPVINRIAPRITLSLDKADEHSANGAAVNRQIRHGYLQLLASLVRGISGVEGNLGIQDHVVGSLVILELDLRRTEVIGNAVEHICSLLFLIDYTGPENLGMRVISSSSMRESQLRLAVAVVHIHQVRLGVDMPMIVVGATNRHTRTDNPSR